MKMISLLNAGIVIVVGTKTQQMHCEFATGLGNVSWLNCLASFDGRPVSCKIPWLGRSVVVTLGPKPLLSGKSVFPIPDEEFSGHVAT